MNLTRRTNLAGLLLLLASVLHAETQEELQAKRAQIIGPEIARGADYTVHSPQAVQTGRGYQCASASTAMTEAEYNARRDAYAKPLQAQLDAIRAEKTALANKRRVQPPMPYEEYQKQYAALNQRETQVSEQWAQEDHKLQQAQRDAQVSASGYLSLFILHTPRDPNATIIPLNGLEPTDGYVAELSSVLHSFLASCGARGSVGISHVYRDLFPGGVDVSMHHEKPILAHSYTLKSGVLTLVRGKVGNSVATTEISGGARNLTLAGAQGRQSEALRETARVYGEYRKDFAIASKRKPGIVYKLDPYWQQYKRDIAMDSARRVFDGDFVGQKESAYFKAQVHGFSEIYSAQCKSEIPSFKRFYLPSSRISATRTYMSGRVENDYESTVIPIDIDTRFAPFYLEYENASRAYLMKSMSVGYEQSGSAANWTEEDVAKVIDWAGNFNIWLGFFRQHKCNSATMLQMRDNLLRAAKSQNSVQKDGVRYPGAEQESDAPQI